MSLRINTVVRKIPQIILIILALFLLGCLIKVALWEHFYYQDKEGSIRDQAIEIGVSVPEPSAVDETPVTDADKAAHIVSPDKPRYLMGAFMGQHTKARVREVGLTSSGAMDTLSGIFDVAWYRNSSKPGQGGTILMNGHKGGPTRIGIFDNLDQVRKGDILTIERGDGAIFKYEVYESQSMPIAQANAYMSTMLKSPVPGKESLSLISCAGDWSQQKRTYNARAMVRAVLVENEE
ncbi:class F sortase [Candidatus Saccharibacteria bacterium]|nr:class F sortase [Candidatus Saccharibacteria bacterium]